MDMSKSQMDNFLKGHSSEIFGLKIFFFMQTNGHRDVKTQSFTLIRLISHYLKLSPNPCKLQVPKIMPTLVIIFRRIICSLWFKSLFSWGIRFFNLKFKYICEFLNKDENILTAMGSIYEKTEGRKSR